MFDVRCFRLVSRQLPAALDRYLVTMRPMQSTRRQSDPCRVAELVFWAIVGGEEVLRRKISLRCAPKVGATWVPCRSENQIMKAELVEAASKVITSPQILVNMVSRRVRQLTLGHRPLVVCAPGLGT